MRYSRFNGTNLLCGLLFVGALSSVAAADPVKAFTKPIEERTVNFSHPGIVESVRVEPGDTVKVGQIIAHEDSREEEATAVAAKAEADNNTEVELERALIAQKNADLKKAEWAHSKGAMSQLELDEARVAVLVEEARRTNAEYKQRLSKLNYDKAQVVVDKMDLRSPIDGRVEKIDCKAGEPVESATKVMRIVNVDQIKIDADVPLELARRLDIGQEARITCEMDKAVLVGKISFIAQDGNAASRTRVVTIKVDNPDKRRTGEWVDVEFPAAAQPVANNHQP